MKMDRIIKRSTAIIFSILLAAFVVGCGGGGSSAVDSGSTKVSIKIGQSRIVSLLQKLFTQSTTAIPSNVAKIGFVISGPDLSPTEEIVDVSGKTEITVTFNVPNGVDRNFLAIALAADGTTSLFQGDVNADLNGTPVDLTIQMGFDISGEWTLTPSDPNGNKGPATFITFSQRGNSFTLTGSDTEGGSFTGSGSIVGSALHLSATGIDMPCGSNFSASLTGAVSANGSAMDGSFTQTGVCSGTPTAGTFTAVKGHIVPAPQADITGAWALTHIEVTPVAGPEEGPEFIKISQTGNSITFIQVDDDGTVKQGNGSIDGNSVQFSFSDTDKCNNPSTVVLTGTLSGDGNTMSGTYSNGGTGNCAETGDWRATKAQPPAFDISGPWSGFRTPQGGSESGPSCFTFAQTGSFLTFTGDVTGSGILSSNNIQVKFADFFGGGNTPICKVINHLTGTVGADGSSASGTYTTSNDCPAGIFFPGGTWRAQKGTLCTQPPAGQGTISGKVVDTLGAPLSGVAVQLFLQGSATANITNNADGTYSLGKVAAGSGYSLEFSKSGFTTVVRDNITVTADAVTQIPDVVMTPVLQAGQTRIVLTWGATPSDLDSHLTGPISGSNTRFHVYFAADCFPDGSCSFDNNGNRIAGPNTLDLLDHDDTDSFGPETTTIVQQISGVYRFSVHDFSNAGSTSSTALSNSGAQVQVFRGSGVVATFNITPGQVGTLWTVFELNGDAITFINTMSNQADSSVIQGGSRSATSLKKSKK